MTKYIKRFELTSQYEEYINSVMAILPNVSLTNDNNIVHYNPFLNYLKFTAEEDNSTISLNAKTSPDIKYSLNGGDWTQWDYSNITLNTGDTVRMKGNNSNGFSTSESSYNQFQMEGKIGASGNIMSLLYEDDFEGKLTIPCNYCFYSMFYGCESLTTAPKLPATTLKDRCYYGMFQGCESLTIAPELSATTLADYCYGNMLYGCKSLTTAPELHATTLTNGCYYQMFMGCSALIFAPELPATTLAKSCYFWMFYGCSSLTTAPELPATTLLERCYEFMFYNCSSLTVAPELPATTLTNGCYQNMFAGCTSLTTAPELPATTLAESCYSQMFYNCTSLMTAPILPATILEYYCYQEMFYGCINLNYIKMLATNIYVTCLNDWVSGVSSTGTFVKDPNMTSLPTGNSGIPIGWTVQDAA